MSVDERDEHYETLPDLGDLAPDLKAAREAEAARTRAAIACVTWHHRDRIAARRNTVVGYVAALLALATVMVAVLTAREAWVWPLAGGALVAIVASAWRSGARINSERDHAPHCTRKANP